MPLNNYQETRYADQEAQSSQLGYNVVFMGIGDGRGNTEGVITWTSFQDEASFLAYLETRNNSDVVIAQGVTIEEAVRLCQETSLDARLNAALEASLVGSEIDPNIYGLHIINLLLLEDFI